MQSRALKIVLTAAVILGGAGVLMFSSMADAEFYKHVEEVMVAPAQWTDKNLKIHGFVEAGSIREEIVGTTTKRSFVLESKGKRVAVRHEGPKPDTFRDLAEVVAKGRLVADGQGGYVLEASELMAKCPSKYQEGQRTRDYGKPPAGSAAAPGAGAPVPGR
jgi:cytochrome c-type biogenesis protein CcmE